jgi:hypothetical protein
MENRSPGDFPYSIHRLLIVETEVCFLSVCCSAVDPKFFFINVFFQDPDSDPALTLIVNPDCLSKIHLNCRSSKHRKKADFFKSIGTFLDPDVYEKYI